MSALFAAELLKLRRQPAVLFWGFLSIPAIAFALKVALEGFFFLRSGNVPRANTDVLLSAAQSLGIAGNPIAQLFYAIGVSSVFFVEYRYSCWRNLVPRAGRIPLLVAKFSVCLVMLLIGLFLTVLGDIALNMALTLIYAGTNVSISAAGIIVLCAAFAIALLELAVLAVLVATITIVFRSMFAAVVPVFLLSITCSLLQAYFGAALSTVPLPPIAADTARAWLFAGIDRSAGVLGFATLLVWFSVLSVINSIAFWRQPLNSE